jgi:hypothetical protein
MPCISLPAPAVVAPDPVSPRSVQSLDVEGVGPVFDEPTSSAAPSPSRCLHVASVDPACTEEQLFTVFRPFGDVEALK